MSSHLAGERMKEVFEAARAGDTERARALDAELAGPLPHALHRAAARDRQGGARELGFELGGVRLPLVEVDEAELAELRRMLDALRPAVAARD